MIEEFYIRKKAETDARGPYARSELESLIGRGEIDRDTLYYDAEVEEWKLFGKDPELRKLLHGPAVNTDMLRGLSGLFFLFVGLGALLPWMLAPGVTFLESVPHILREPFYLAGALYVCAMFPVGILKKGVLWTIRVLAALGAGFMVTSLWLRGEPVDAAVLGGAAIALMASTWALGLRGLMISLLSIAMIGALVFLALRIIHI